MARAPVRQIEANAQLRPVAAPVDTYSQPAQSPLRGLAEGLATLSAPLQDMLEQRSKKQKEEDKLRGNAAVYSDHAEELREGVASGKIPPQYSPAFMEGFKNADGDLAGGKLVGKFSSAFESWSAKDTATDEQYDEFIAGFLKENVSTQDPQVLKGLLPQVNVLENNARQMWVAHKAKTVAQGFMDTSVALGMQDVDKFRQEGLTTEEGTDYKAMFGSIAQRRAEFTSKGGSGADFDKTMLEGLSAKIMETKDPQLLEMFDEKIPGTDRKYSDVPDFLKLKNATLDNLTSFAHSQLVSEAQKTKTEREQKKDQAVSGIIDFMVKNPGAAEVPEALIKQAEQNGEETIRTKLKTWREDLTPTRKTDPGVVADLQQKMLDNPARANAIYKDAVDKRIFAGDPEAMRSVNSFKDGLSENADVIEKAIGSSSMTRIMDSIAKRGGERNEVGDLITGLSQQALAAQYDLKNMVMNFIMANPEAKSYEIDNFINTQGANVLKNFQLPAGGDEMMDAFDYTRDPNLSFDNPILEGQTDGEETTGGPAANPSDKAGQPAYEALPPEQKKVVEDLAKQRKVTPQAMWQEIIKSNGEVKPISYSPADDLGEGDARPNGLTLEKANAVIEGAMGEGGSVEAMRKLVISAETNGDYNAVWGKPPGSVDLSKYSVDDILAEQQRARAAGIESTAVGAGQFIYKTLKGLKSELGLTGKEPFTPDLQNKMIDTLLVRRGLDDFQSGKISQRQFATRLSQEFAALPNPNTGRSFYAGDGLNASRTHIRNVYQAMGVPVSYTYEDAPPEVQGISGPTNPVKLAKAFVGASETQHAGAIGAFLKRAAGQNINPRETAWCAAFVNSVLGATGGKGTGSLMARSFLEWGEPVSKPAEGDIAVFKRGSSSTQGHVGFYMGTVEKNGKQYIRVLGGNQSNGVNEKSYPADQLLGLRRVKQTAGTSA